MSVGRMRACFSLHGMLLKRMHGHGELPMPGCVGGIMPAQPTGTVTLLFSDIEGSTRLLHQLGERYQDVLITCRLLLRETFQRWYGHEVDTQGDAFFVAFARATDAVWAAA